MALEIFLTSKLHQTKVIIRLFVLNTIIVEIKSNLVKILLLLI